MRVRVRPRRRVRVRLRVRIRLSVRIRLRVRVRLRHSVRVKVDVIAARRRNGMLPFLWRSLLCVCCFFFEVVYALKFRGLVLGAE